MRMSFRTVCWMAGILCLTACGERSPSASTPVPMQSAVAVTSSLKANVIVQLLPEKPTSSDCIQVIIKSQPETSQINWFVNGQPVGSSNQGKLCPDVFHRGDQVVAKVGGETGGSSTVTIGNSPPKITGISATPEQVFSASDLQVTPVAEDKDGDPVEFRYQWLINGDANPFLTENTLKGDHFNKGDVIQVRITPYDGIDEGPIYESYKMTIPNAPPRIESTPPQKFEALEYSYQVKANDPDGDSLTWRLDKAPQGMTINPASGLVSWPLTGVKPGAYPMKIVVGDPEGAEAFQEFTLTLGAPK